VISSLAHKYYTRMEETDTKNTLAYNGKDLNTVAKTSIIQSPGANVINLFSVIYKFY